MLVSPDDVQGPWSDESANEKTVRGCIGSSGNVGVIEINIWKRNSTVKNFPIRTEFRSVFNAFDQSFDQFYCLFFSVEFLFHIFISMVGVYL